MAQCADSGAPLLRASSGPGSQFADDRLAASDELVPDERVHDLLRCAGSSGVLVLRACGTDGSSGNPMLESFSSGCAADVPGELLAKAGVSGCGREHSALQVLLSAGDGVPGLVAPQSSNGGVSPVLLMKDTCATLAMSTFLSWMVNARMSSVIVRIPVRSRKGLTSRSVGSNSMLPPVPV